MSTLNTINRRIMTALVIVGLLTLYVAATQPYVHGADPTDIFILAFVGIVACGIGVNGYYAFQSRAHVAIHDAHVDILQAAARVSESTATKIPVDVARPITLGPSALAAIVLICITLITYAYLSH